MYTILTKYTDIKDYFDARDFSTCAFDTETTSLLYTELEITGCSFSNGDATCYINLYNNSERGQILSLIDTIFATKIKSVVMHNAPFDMKVLHKYDISLESHRIFCTMTAHHLINENANHGLKELARHYLKAEAISFEEASRKGFDSEEFLQYACNDAKWTWDLHKIFNKKLFELGVNRLFFEVEMPFQFTLMDMAINGVPVNIDKLDALREKATATHFDILKNLHRITGREYQVTFDMFTNEPIIESGYNFGSKNFIRTILKERGLTSPYKTKKTKEVSVGRETMLHLKGDEFIDELNRYNIVSKLLSSFINKMPKFIESDGRVRASFWNTGTGTGRLSCSEPNMQQNPKEKDELPFDFKDIFEGSEGKVIVSADYSGQELRILAIVSNDDVLLDAFKLGKDLHLMTANAVFDLGIDSADMVTSSEAYKEIKEKYDKERHIGKNGYNFPIIYGTTAYGISKNNGISEAEAQRGIDKFFSAYPKVRSAIKRCSDFLNDNWHVRSLTRRRRRLNPHEKKSHRQAFNFLIQSLAADMIRCACNKVRKVFNDHPEWEAKTLMIVHDEIVFEVKEEYAEEAAKIISEVMATAMNLSLRMPVEVGIGKSYSEAK